MNRVFNFQKLWDETPAESTRKKSIKKQVLSINNAVLVITVKSLIL